MQERDQRNLQGQTRVRREVSSTCVPTELEPRIAGNSGVWVRSRNLGGRHGHGAPGTESGTSLASSGGGPPSRWSPFVASKRHSVCLDLLMLKHLEIMTTAHWPLAPDDWLDFSVLSGSLAGRR